MAGGEQSNIFGMKCVDILQGIDASDNRFFINVSWQGKLHENAMYGGIRIEVADEVEKARLGNAGGKLMVKADHSRLFTGFSLVADVNVAGRVVADKNRRQTGRTIGERDVRGYCGCNFSAHGFGELVSVESDRWHG